MQAGNLYAHCGNNPLKYIDLNGLTANDAAAFREADQQSWQNFGENWVFYVPRDYVADPIARAAGMTTTDIANEWAGIFESRYGPGTQTHIYAVLTPADLVNELSRINQQGSANNVVLIGHGSIRGYRGSGIGHMNFEGKGRLYATTHSRMGLSDRAVDELGIVSMRNLILAVCNSAHRDVYSIAVGFRNNHDIWGFITGGDSGVFFDFAAGRLVAGGGDPNQNILHEIYRNTTWWQWAEKTWGSGLLGFLFPARTREGVIRISGRRCADEE